MLRIRPKSITRQSKSVETQLNRSLFIAASVLSGVLIGTITYIWLPGFKNNTSASETVTAAEQTFTSSRNPPADEPTSAENPQNNNGSSASNAGQTTQDASQVLNADKEPDDSNNTFSRHSFHDGILRVAPSVVSLYASEPVPNSIVTPRDDGSLNPAIAQAEKRRSNQGSGVIISKDGLILTNTHLIDGTDDINVVLSDGSLHAAKVVGIDRETDLAVVQITATDLKPANINNDTRLRVGDIVLAIGNPFGVGQTVTMGIVSATRRQVAGGSAWQNFVQIDAAINPGNSGGALINPDGELVGINTGVFLRDTGAEGIGFAIPIELVASIVPQLIANGQVSRGWLGISADDLPMYPAINRVVKEGVVITAVLADGPAAHFGLSAYDVVTTINDKKVINAQEMLLQISSLSPGDKVKLGLNRAGALASLVVTLGERPNFKRN